MVPYRGPVRNTIHQIIGGVRSSMGYCGCKTIEDFGNKSVFTEITAAGVKENHPHEVRIVKKHLTIRFLIARFFYVREFM